MDKIITRIHGGLGNQLFQLIAARYLSVKNNKKKIEVYTADLKSFATKRDLEIEALFKRETTISAINPWDQLALKYKVSKILSLVDLHSISNVTQINNWKGQYLNGYFQDIYNYSDYNLISRLANELEKDFSITISKEKLAPFLYLTSFGAIHLRLTDFITENKNLEFLKEFRLPYILKSVEWLQKSYGLQKFVVFTDDLPLAKTLLAGEHFLFFKEMPKADFNLLEEFYLLSSFKYLITSNSTFSFWSTVFGKEKTIVFPSLWKHDNKREDGLFKRNIAVHAKMFPKNNYIHII